MSNVHGMIRSAYTFDPDEMDQDHIIATINSILED